MLCLIKYNIMKTILLTFLWIVSITLVSTTAFGQDREKEEKYDKLFNNLYLADGPGGTALIAINGKIIYLKAFGKANLELNVDMQPNHVFRIASITKVFTACAILKLMEEGKLSLQDTIPKYIEDSPPYWHHITIEHLLTHTSGISGFSNPFRDEEFNKIDHTPKEMIDYIKLEPMDFAPGEKYYYANLQYLILGYIIEKVSGKTYEAYVEENLFQPLGMKNSYYENANEIIINRASGYQTGLLGYENDNFFSPSTIYSEGALLSTVEDLSTWYYAVADGKVISKESLEKSLTPFILNNGKAIESGYGWSFGNIQGSPWFGHNGSMEGFLSTSFFLPEEKVFVAVLGNCFCQSHAPYDVAYKIAGIAIDKPFEWIEISLNDTDLLSYTGVYESDSLFGSDEQLIISLEEDKLYSMLKGRMKLQIFPYEKNNFFIKNGLTTLKFQRDKKGKITDVIVERPYSPIVLKRTEKEIPKYTAIELNSEVLEKYLGKYELQPNLIFEITMEGTKLYLQLTAGPKIEIIPYEYNKFFTTVGDGQFIFNFNDQQVVMSMTLVQNQKFQCKKIE